MSDLDLPIVAVVDSEQILFFTLNDETDEEKHKIVLTFHKIVLTFFFSN